MRAFQLKIAGPVFFLWLCGASAIAKPFTPDSDSDVLERIPAAAEMQRVTPLRKQLAAHPDDEISAIALATVYLELGRRNGDPRFTSYAEATLAPWLSLSNPPSKVLTLGATALQSTHRFNESLAMLDRALKADPSDAQGWLTRATIQQVLGHFDDARRSCGRLVQSAGHLVAVTCLASVNSLNGRLAESYRSLSAIYNDDPRLPASVRSWALGQLAEMAVRLGDAPAAEKYFRAGLAVTPDDIYLKSDYADLLISQGRNDEVVQMLEKNEAQDNLLLRLAIASQTMRHRDAARWAQMFEDRYQAARRGGDFTHLREQARFELEVRKQTALALQLAQRNWEVQHEPADIRVFLQAAGLANNEAAAKPVLDWIKQVNYEDHTLGQHLASNDAVKSR